MNKSVNNLYNLENVKAEASQSLDRGAITQDYPLDLNEVYQHLNAALATEIICVLRYRHHEIIATGIDCKEIAAEFREHAVSEEQHMLMIAERINQLGGNPNLHPLFAMQNSATEYGTATTTEEMLKEDLIAERIVIIIYKKLIEWFGEKDPTTRRMLEQILADEEDHANDLADLLAN